MSNSTHMVEEEGVPRTGYAPDFLGTSVDVPALDPGIRDDTVMWNGAEVIPYTHFSLSLSSSRRFARWVAWNIDGASIKLVSRAGMDFTKDPRLPAASQVGNELYSGNRLDRGHIARRADLLWGELPEAKQANRDSFHYTNITPQMDDFNQSSQNGIWGRLEDALYEDVDVDDLRASIFGGPVFHDDDRTYRGTALPREYWKLVAFTENATLKARAFLLTQDLGQLRAVLDLDEFRVYQITLAELEERTKLHFPGTLHAADTPATPATRDPRDREPLDTTAAIRW